MDNTEWVWNREQSVFINRKCGGTVYPADGMNLDDMLRQMESHHMWCDEKNKDK